MLYFTQQERKIVDMPWHERNSEGAEKEVLHYPGLPTKRTPIKGTVNYSGQLLIEYNSVACAQITVVFGMY